MSRMRVLALGVLLLASAAIQAAPFQNGSFESGTLINSGSFDELHIGSTAITGWSVLGPAGVDYISSGYWQAADGVRSLDLVGCDDGGGVGGIEQTFDTAPGMTYMVTFAMAGNPDGSPVVKTMMVSAAGQSASYAFDTAGKSVGDMGWQARSFWFTATSGSTTLRFDNTSDGLDCAGAALDNVVVTAMQTVPVQDSAWGAAAAIMLAALFVLPWLRRREDRRA